MATSEHPLYSFPSWSFSDTLWTDWKVEPSSPSHDEEDFKFDPSWETSVYPMPEYYCSSLDEYSDQATTPSSISPIESSAPGQFSDTQLDTASWVSPLDTITPAFPATPIVPSNTHGFSSERESLSNRSSISSTPSDHSSPSDSARTPSSPDRPVRQRRRTNRAKGPIQCWEHSCGGRAFSSLGNYERHLREKSGKAKSFHCEKCNQRFTRSTAKNKHIKFGRCRGRPTEAK